MTQNKSFGRHTVQPISWLTTECLLMSHSTQFNVFFPENWSIFCQMTSLN